VVVLAIDLMVSSGQLGASIERSELRPVSSKTLHISAAQEEEMSSSCNSDGFNPLPSDVSFAKRFRNPYESFFLSLLIPFEGSNPLLC
jgi:hypothetical protein